VGLDLDITIKSDNNKQLMKPLYNHYTGQTMLAVTPCKELDDFFGSNFYCPWLWQLAYSG